MRVHAIAEPECEACVSCVSKETVLQTAATADKGIATSDLND